MCTSVAVCDVTGSERVTTLDVDKYIRPIICQDFIYLGTESFIGNTKCELINNHHATKEKERKGKGERKEEEQGWYCH